MEDSKPTKKQRESNNMMVIGLALGLIALVLLIVFFLSGKTDISGEFPDPESAVSVTCKSATADYPFFESNAANKKAMDIKVVANGDKISTVSLVYHLYFDTQEEIMGSRDRNHFAVNKAFEKDNMEADSLGAMYSMLKDNFKFSLFARASDLNSATVKYFLLNDLKDEDGYAYSAVKNAYQSQGFTCTEDGK